MDNESYRVGFEAAIELCITETVEADSKEKALSKMYEFLGLVKDDKLERLKEMLWHIKK
jgi:ribosome assembly protein YihI (activator of Der GTPase)